jgi:hypothetical protein
VTEVIQHLMWLVPVSARLLQAQQQQCVWLAFWSIPSHARRHGQTFKWHGLLSAILQLMNALDFQNAVKEIGAAAKYLKGTGSPKVQALAKALSAYDARCPDGREPDAGMLLGWSHRRSADGAWPTTSRMCCLH